MILRHRIFLSAAIAASVALAASVATAPAADAQTYPQGPGVASLSVANGSVVVVRGDGGAQVAATVNSPLLPGDYITTGPGSDAEVQYDGASMLRLAQNTQVRLVNLNPGQREAQLAAGTVDVAELQGSGGGPQLDTPSLTVRPNQAGDSRVSVLGNGQTVVTVRSGSAQIVTGNASQTLSPGSTLVASGPYGTASLSSAPAVGWDSFDQFNASRDQTIASAYNANPYISPQLAGYANLASYGQWQNVPGYGYSWAPSNQATFAPYQSGQWVWEPGYGYTWVASQPWGYAPSHYGTWFNNAQYGGWNWQPPGYQYQSTSSALASAWAPALVSFFLTGNNANDAGGLLSALLGGNAYPNYYNSSNIGWVPLAPGEPYQPWYGQNSTYPATSVTNVTNVTNIYRYYTNARYYRGITMVPVSAWRAGNFRHVVVLQPNAARQIVLLRGGIPVAPSAANLHYAAVAPGRTVALSRTFSTPRFVAKAPRVVAFSTQQTQIQHIAATPARTVALPPAAKPLHPVYQPAAHPKPQPVPIPKRVTPAPQTAHPVPHAAATPKPQPHVVETMRPRPVAPQPVHTSPRYIAPHATPRPLPPHPVAPPVHPVAPPHVQPPHPVKSHTAPPHPAAQQPAAKPAAKPAEHGSPAPKEPAPL